MSDSTRSFTAAILMYVALNFAAAFFGITQGTAEGKDLFAFLAMASFSVAWAVKP